jgi:hypothetical protein|tara:strand:+ start:339 stop:521 length:183 start_codon:yes stop_codon:yes gene_type:complete
MNNKTIDKILDIECKLDYLYPNQKFETQLINLQRDIKTINNGWSQKDEERYLNEFEKELN